MSLLRTHRARIVVLALLGGLVLGFCATQLSSDMPAKWS
jgi:hypothetical protein